MRDLTKTDLNAIRQVVHDTLSSDFDGIRILDVKIDEDIDSAGDPLLRIDVIFSGKSKDLDAGKLSGVVRHLRPKLDEIDIRAFPLMSFISEADAKKRASV